MIDALRFAANWTARIDFTNTAFVRAQLEATNAFAEAGTPQRLELPPLRHDNAAENASPDQPKGSKDWVKMVTRKRSIASPSSGPSSTHPSTTTLGRSIRRIICCSDSAHEPRRVNDEKSNLVVNGAMVRKGLIFPHHH